MNRHADRLADAFDHAFRKRAGKLFPRSENDGDRAFLTRLFIAGSPLTTCLPPPLLLQQAEAQEASHRAQHPLAMRRIVVGTRGPIARLVIDWGDCGASYAVDIAAMPDDRSSGVGLHLLRAWLQVADAEGIACRLDVRRDNPVVRLYARLGFAAVDVEDDTFPMLAMTRPPAAPIKA